MNCRCGNEAPYNCAWKLRKPFVIFSSALKVGDSVGGVNKLGYFKVVSIGKNIGGSMHVFLEGIDRPFLVTAPLVSIMRDGNCDAACCDFCCREVADGVQYCIAHWDTGEMMKSGSAKTSELSAD